MESLVGNSYLSPLTQQLYTSLRQKQTDLIVLITVWDKKIVV